MDSAVYQTIVNVAVATLFTIAFTLVSLRRKTKGRSFWFAISYFAGTLTPLSELLVRFTPYPTIFMAMSFASFSLAFHLMAKGLSVYYRQPVNNWLLATSFLLSLFVRAAIWGGERNTMPYELLYQLPFAVSMGLCAAIVISIKHKGGLEYALMALFTVMAIQFLIKSAVAVWLHSGDSAPQYLGSHYALFSQSISAILLIAIALTLLLVLMRDTVQAADTVAEVDVLSRLFNRRGFNERASVALERAQKRSVSAAFLLCDLDHFKRINDRFGHATGDQVIERFADVLRLVVSERSIIGRLGGEEFAVYMDNVTARTAHDIADTIRRGIAGLSFDNTDLQVTVSIGVAMAQASDSLSALCERADIALYRAKQAGRNQVKFDAMA